MKKLNQKQWIAVTVALIVIIIFYVTGHNLVSFFSAENGQASATATSMSATDMAATDAGASTNGAQTTNNQTQTMDTDNSFASSVAGFEMTDEKVGTGAEAVAGKMITVNYTGAFTDGKVFDSSIGRGPFTFTLGAGQVIQGWDQGFAGMKVGGKRRLVIPPALGYGAQGAGNVIPPNSTLVFEVELLGVK